ncbi:Type IV pilus biogenesis protein PilM [Salmonella bongori]|nr:Type IV pilus biogenesis protein PilM [Salmonella bongori]
MSGLGVMSVSGCGRRAMRGGRKSTREAATLHDLAAMLSVMPEHIALCAEGEFDPWCAVTVRQPPVPSDGHRFAIAIGLAMGEIR